MEEILSDSLTDRVTIIMVTRDRPDRLHATLGRIRHSPCRELPIIVHDDASRDSARVRDVVEAWPNTKMIRSAVPVGPGIGRNICMQHATTPFCLSMDDDVFPRMLKGLPHWLMDRPEDRDIAIVGFQYYRTFDGALSPASDVSSGPALAFHGGASLLRRELVLQYGGYYDLLFFGGEDTELALYLRKQGFRIWYDNNVVMEHDCDFSKRNHRLDFFHYLQSIAIINFTHYGAVAGFSRTLRNYIGRTFHLWRQWVSGKSPISPIIVHDIWLPALFSSYKICRTNREKVQQRRTRQNTFLPKR